jgi:predicted nucleic acid-binding protein
MRNSAGWRPSSTTSCVRSIASAPKTGLTATSFTVVQFLDTNVLLYAISRDVAERERAARANDLMSGRDVALSAQILQEFYVQATRPSRPDALSHHQAARLVESFLRFRIQEVTTAIMLAALATRQRFQISYWDAAILEASRALGCDVVLSEDLSDGMDYDGVRVENPFS